MVLTPRAAAPGGVGEPMQTQKQLDPAGLAALFQQHAAQQPQPGPTADTRPPPVAVAGAAAVCAADPTATELEDFGAAISARIGSLQNTIVGPGQVSNQKIVVHLSGPKMPNLSLVDLPGLRAVDDPSTVGLKVKVQTMVSDIIATDSAIVLAIAPATADPNTWVGRGLAMDVDPQQKRTVGVVTKVDTIFGIETETNQLLRDQLRAVIQREKTTPYYAAYNPSAEDQSAISGAGVDLVSKIGKAFQPGRVGNQAIAHDLEERLSAHVTRQLPLLHRQLSERLGELESDLHMDSAPSWHLVEQILLTYARLVQSYAQNKVAHPDGVVAGAGLRNQWEGESFQLSLDKLLNQFLVRVSPTAVYSNRGSAASILRQPTQMVLQTLNEMGRPDPRTGEPPRTDSEIAYFLGIELSTMMQDLSGEVLVDLEQEVLVLAKRFYQAVAEVHFTLEKPSRADTRRPRAKARLSPAFHLGKYAELKSIVAASTNKLLEQTWEKVLQKADTEFADPTVAAVNAAFMPLEAVTAALQRICAACALDAQTGQPVQAPPEAAMLLAPPEGICWKQGESLSRWAERFVRVVPTDVGGALGIFKNGQACASSIQDLRGCTVVSSTVNFMLAGTYFSLEIHGDHLNKSPKRFCFADELERDRFAKAILNLSEGRPWDKTAEDVAEEAERLAAERAAGPRQSFTVIGDGRPAFATLCEASQVRIGRADWQLLLQNGSPEFRKFYDHLQAAPWEVRHLIDDEVRAEAVRIWALQYVQFKTNLRFSAVDAELKSRLYDAESADAPFSAVSIFRSVAMANMVVRNMNGDGQVGPEQLLRYHDNTDDREEKLRQRDKLRDICQRFAATGMEEFMHGGEQQRIAFGGSSAVTAAAARNKRYLGLVNDLQGIDISDLGLTGTSDGRPAGRIDWPQICVVGGQSEGKSTLLSAIVSSKLGMTMKFLPEGTGMVTRLPILVQMSCDPQATQHTATVRTEGSGNQ
jgi:hypothetical protein